MTSATTGTLSVLRTTSASERALHQQAIAFHVGPDPVRIRRMLERPFGSVRWKEDTPDARPNEVLPVVASAAAAARKPRSSRSHHSVA